MSQLNLPLTHYVVLYPQNGDRIVTIDSVTSLHPVYSACPGGLYVLLLLLNNFIFYIYF